MILLDENVRAIEMIEVWGTCDRLMNFIRSFSISEMYSKTSHGGHGGHGGHFRFIK